MINIDKYTGIYRSMTRPSLNYPIVRAGNRDGARQRPYLFDLARIRSVILQLYNRASASHCKQKTCNFVTCGLAATGATVDGGRLVCGEVRGFQGVTEAGACEVAGDREVGGGRVERSYITDLERVRGPIADLGEVPRVPLGHPVRVEVTGRYHPFLMYNFYHIIFTYIHFPEILCR